MKPRERLLTSIFTLAGRACLLAVAGTMLLAGCAMAAHPQAVDPDDEALGGKGARVVNKGKRYVWLTEVRAVNAGRRTDDPGLRLAEMGVDAEAVVGHKASMILYRPRKKTGARNQFTPAKAGAGETTYPVVQNEETGALGIVLGTIQVKLADTGQAGALARKHGLKVKLVYKRLGYVVFTAGAGKDPFATAKALASEAGVEKASVEILENPALPH